MKLTSFTYTKEFGEVSERVLVELSAPTDKFFGVDVSELSEDTQTEVYGEFQKAYDEYMAKCNETMAKYDIRTNFRFFKFSRVTNRSVLA